MKKKTTILLATPFATEEEFEKLVFGTSEVLEDIFVLQRQIRGGGKPGVPDIVGIDADGKVCIIEMKNVAVDAGIIPQVLQYAFWAENNPDSIKSLWLQAEDKPEDVSVAWDGFKVRIIVIAPTIHRSTLALVDKINYEVDLIEVKRWVEGTNTFLLVNRLEPEAQVKVRPVAGLAKYDAEFYRENYNRESATAFLKYVKDVKSLVQANGWNLEMKFNKQYCGFKAGFFNAFGIKWVSSKTFALFFKLPKSALGGFRSKITRYDKIFGEAVFSVDPERTRIETYRTLFAKAHHRLTGD